MKGKTKGNIKFILITILRIVTRIFCFFPLKSNQILFYANSGNSYNGNSLYLSNFLVKNFKDQFDIIWQFKNPAKYKYLKKSGIKVIGYFSIIGMYYYYTAKVICDDQAPRSYFKRRNRQLIINTWHGGGAYKKVGFNENGLNRYDKDIWLKMSYENVSLFISTCKIQSDKMIRSGLHYKGEIMECGMPRNDFLLCERDQAVEKKIRDALHISQDKKIVLYAPTWQEDNSGINLIPDFMDLSSFLSKQWGGDWIVLMRFHPVVHRPPVGNTIDVSQYPDMQELLYISDVLITDYSSCMWDMSLMYKPVFLYVPDLERYDRERGFYTDPYSWGFPLCKTYSELKQAILNYDEKKYHDIVDKHHADLGICETGHATELVCERICKECGVEWRASAKT